MNELAHSTVTTKAFSKWKIMLALIVGISVSSVVLYRSFSVIQFKAVREGTGTYTWSDSNHNGKIDWSNRSEFIRVSHGNFRQETAGTILKNIHWSTQTVFWLLLLQNTPHLCKWYKWHLQVLLYLYFLKYNRVHPLQLFSE